MMEGWIHGNYDLDEVPSNLRKLERPIPGRGGTHLSGLSGYQGMHGNPTMGISMEGQGEEVPAGMNKVRAARARERESTQLSRATHVSVPARPLAGARGLRP